MAIECIYDHPRLFIVADASDLVILAMRVMVRDTSFEYTNGDARAFVAERTLILGMEAMSLNTGRHLSAASNSGSIQLAFLESNADDSVCGEEHLAAEFDSMSINLDNDL
jgi:hypothetical protein